MAEINFEIEKVINKLDIGSELLVNFFHCMLLLKAGKSTECS